MTRPRTNPLKVHDIRQPATPGSPSRRLIHCQRSGIALPEKWQILFIFWRLLDSQLASRRLSYQALNDKNVTCLGGNQKCTSGLFLYLLDSSRH